MVMRRMVANRLGGLPRGYDGCMRDVMSGDLPSMCGARVRHAVRPETNATVQCMVHATGASRISTSRY